MDHSALHRETYNDLAEEYESRVAALLPVTAEVMDYFAPYIKPRGRVLDVGCGVGIALSVLSERDFRLTGLEISEEMARRAQARNPQAEIIIADFLSADLPCVFDAIITFAFIHLFPKIQAVQILNKLGNILTEGGVLLITTTESEASKEGWEIKDDFIKKRKRFRKFWTEEELRFFLIENGFEIIALKKIKDPFGKTWMDFVVKKK